ncbi:FAD/NAD(P)-binding domain-containing protein, partial [Aureobasidium melanogenum]
MPFAAQPRHRRPSWRQSRVSHRTYLETDFKRKQEHEMPADADSDTFYYNAAFVVEWLIPADLRLRLPESLVTELDDWQAAGAAVCTALARIDKLDDESLHRGWPSRPNLHLSRTTSDCSAIGSPQFSTTEPFEISSPPSRPALSSLQTSFGSTLSTSPDAPPFTPQDSIMGDEVDEISTSLRDKVSLEHVDAMLATRVRRVSESAGSPSPLMSPISRQSSSELTFGTDQRFDESAWETFLRSYEAELEHLRTETLVRFRHIGKSVDRLWLDLRCDGVHPVSESTAFEFVAWWKKMNDKEQEYEKEVQMLEAPQLELVSLRRPLLKLYSMMLQESLHANHYDIIVVGSGAAGLTAALSAKVSNPDLRIIIVEKAPREWRGGNGYFTAGAYRTAHDGLSSLLPLVSNVPPELRDKIDLAPYTAEDLQHDLQRVTGGRSDKDLGAVLVKDSLDTVRWLKEHGNVDWWLSFRRQAYEVQGRWKFWGGLALTVKDGGKGLIKNLSDAVAAKGIVTLFDTKVERLILDGERGIAGVQVVSSNNADFTPKLYAPSVILCAGGFEASRQLRESFMGANWRHAHVRGTPYNTGDMLLAALDLDAKKAGDYSHTGCHSVSWD